MPAPRDPGREQRAFASPEPAPPLAATLVTYADRPDRRTVYPPDATSVSRMSTWLTADAGAFVGLESMR
ncbi:MAG: hypothetical protein ABEJ05_07110 [Haloglomus sp.]